MSLHPKKDHVSCIVLGLERIINIAAEFFRSRNLKMSDILIQKYPWHGIVVGNSVLTFKSMSLTADYNSFYIEEGTHIIIVGNITNSYGRRAKFMRVVTPENGICFLHSSWFENSPKIINSVSYGRMIIPIEEFQDE